MDLVYLYKLGPYGDDGLPGRYQCQGGTFRTTLARPADVDPLLIEGWHLTLAAALAERDEPTHSVVEDPAYMPEEIPVTVEPAIEVVEPEVPVRRGPGRPRRMP